MMVMGGGGDGDGVDGEFDDDNDDGNAQRLAIMGDGRWEMYDPRWMLATRGT